MPSRQYNQRTYNPYRVYDNPQSMFVPQYDVETLRENSAARQQRADATRSANAQAMSALNDIDTYGEDSRIKKQELIDSLESNYDDLASKYNYDLSRASGDMYGFIGNLKKDDFWKLNEYGVEQGKLEDAQRRTMTANGKNAYTFSESKGAWDAKKERYRTKDEMTFDVREQSKSVDLAKEIMENIKSNKSSWGLSEANFLKLKTGSTDSIESKDLERISEDMKGLLIDKDPQFFERLANEAGLWTKGMSPQEAVSVLEEAGHDTKEIAKQFIIDANSDRIFKKNTSQYMNNALALAKANDKIQNPTDNLYNIPQLRTNTNLNESKPNKPWVNDFSGFDYKYNKKDVDRRKTQVTLLLGAMARPGLGYEDEIKELEAELKDLNEKGTEDYQIKALKKLNNKWTKYSLDDYDINEVSSKFNITPATNPVNGQVYFTPEQKSEIIHQVDVRRQQQESGDIMMYNGFGKFHGKQVANAGGIAYINNKGYNISSGSDSDREEFAKDLGYDSFDKYQLATTSGVNIMDSYVFGSKYGDGFSIAGTNGKEAFVPGYNRTMHVATAPARFVSDAIRGDEDYAQKIIGNTTYIVYKTGLEEVVIKVPNNVMHGIKPGATNDEKIEALSGYSQNASNNVDIFAPEEIYTKNATMIAGDKKTALDGYKYNYKPIHQNR